MLKAFMQGAREFRLTCTTYYSDYDQQHAYDWGRECAHLLTFRRFEP